MLTAEFAGELFGAGQPLDATKYFIILPDALGTGKSTKPSDGLRAKFPAYNYDDMVEAQYRLVTEGLGVKHLRLVIGNSMGGMQTWQWAVKYPGFMDAAAPMASQPTAMAGRNWMMRRLLTEAIRRDPEWKNGDYEKQPSALRYANAVFGVATSGGSQAWHRQAPTAAAGDKLVEARLAAPFTGDANDVLARLRSLAGPREDRGRAARHQRSRRRAQPARTRRDGSVDQAGEERPRLHHSREPRHAGPRHDGRGEILEGRTREAARRSAAPRDVKRGEGAYAFTLIFISTRRWEGWRGSDVAPRV
jgi:homoserine acetyltransferase